MEDRTMKTLWRVTLRTGPGKGEKKGWAYHFVVLAETPEAAVAAAKSDWSHDVPEYEEKIRETHTEPYEDIVVPVGVGRR
jgi:hypothetical protein